MEYSEKSPARLPYPQFENGLSLEELQRRLKSQDYFVPIDVKLETKVYWELKPGQSEVERIEKTSLNVTVRKVKVTDRSCHVALAFDVKTREFVIEEAFGPTPPELEPQKTASEKGKSGAITPAEGDDITVAPDVNTRILKFKPPKKWVPLEGPRFIVVLISLAKVTKEQFEEEYLNSEDPKITFSLHPMLVPGPSQDEEELLLARKTMSKKERTEDLEALW